MTTFYYYKSTLEEAHKLYDIQWVNFFRKPLSELVGSGVTILKGGRGAQPPPPILPVLSKIA